MIFPCSTRPKQVGLPETELIFYDVLGLLVSCLEEGRKKEEIFGVARDCPVRGAPIAG